MENQRQEEKFVEYYVRVVTKPTEEPNEDNLFAALSNPGAQAYLQHMLAQMVLQKTLIPITAAEDHYRLDGKIKLMQYLLTGE